MRGVAASFAVLCGAALALHPSPARGQAADSVAASDSTRLQFPQKAKKESRFYYGGSLGLSASSSVTWIRCQPFVGYKLTPKASLGARLTYQYVRDRRYDPAIRSLQYGGSVFTRYRVLTRGFLIAEFEELSIDLSGERELVPFLLLGGGWLTPLGPKSAVLVEVLVDVLRDERGKLYRNQEPRINVGIGVGY